MCTVTIVPIGDGFRLMCNRDERRDRPAAIPPTVRLLQHRTACYPQDSLEGGTWVGVNDAGLAVALLNRNAGDATRVDGRFRSRGLIIPTLLDCRSVSDALERASHLDPTEFQPFRIVVIQRTSAGVLTSNGHDCSVEIMSTARPAMFTSSSLGDAIVDPPRRRLFDQVVTRNPVSWLLGQADFHDHQWPSQSAISIRMERPDARTVSRTVVNVMPGTIELDYDPFSSPVRRVNLVP